MNSKKTIIIFIHSLGVGGMERVASELVNNFSKNSCLDIHVILFGSKRDVFYDISNNITIHKPKFEFNEKKKHLHTLKTIFFLRKKVKKIKPDSMLSFGEYWNNLVLISTLGLKYKIYIADRSKPMKSLGRLQNFLRKLLYPFANGLIVQTKKAKEIYLKTFKNLPIHVVGNPIRAINKVSINKENIIITVGRLIYTKHHDRLVNIFSKIKTKSEWKLVIVGDDSQKQSIKANLEKLIHDLNIEDRVVLAGKQKNVEQYYLKSKIFAFTSSSEGFPNVIGEAMSASLPVVCYDCIAGPSDMITDNFDGFLIPQFNDDEFLLKLQLLMDDESLIYEMGKNAKRSIKKFNVEEISQKILQIIY